MVEGKRLYQSHEERTAEQPRRGGLHAVVVKQVDEVNKNIRLLRLNIIDQQRGVEFLPGQWLDAHFPGLSKAGGFTITSTPYDARSFDTRQPHEGSGHLLQDATPYSYLELAVQSSPRNPAAVWLWQDLKQIETSPFMVRVGGSFVWPPPGIRANDRQRVVFVAGGVGINPLISMLSHLHGSNEMPQEVILLYSTKAGPQHNDSDILFLPRIRTIANARGHQVKVELFLTGEEERNWKLKEPLFRTWFRRLLPDDVDKVLGSVEQRRRTICYVCGPQAMTDAFVAAIESMEGMPRGHVLCEKWW